jgi:hypothetical protein
MAFDPKKPFEIESADPLGSGNTYYKLNTNQGTFYYAPTEWVTTGDVRNGYQYYQKQFANQKDILSNAKNVVLPSGLVTKIEGSGRYENPNQGYVFSEDQWNKLNIPVGTITYYKIDSNDPSKSPIKGMGDVVKDVNKFGKVTDTLFTYYQGMEKSGNKTIFYRIGAAGGTGKTTISDNTPGWAKSLRDTPFVAELAGLASGAFFGPTTGAYTYAALKGGQLGAQGVNPLEAGAQVAATYALTSAIGNAMAEPSVGGTPGVSEVYPVDMGYTAPGTPIPPSVPVDLPPIDLLGNTTFPGQGIQVPSIDSSQVALLPDGTVLPGEGLISPTMPGVPSMGGGTGLTVGVPGGTVGELGFTPEGAVPVLGDPGSFINDPAVLGRDVLQTAPSTISLSDAFRAARTINNLMGMGQEQPSPQRQELPGMQATGVDLLRLPQFSAGTPNIASLLAPMRYNATPSFDLITGQSLLPPRTLSLLG